MPEGFLSPWHLLILAVVALIIFGIPLLLVFLLVRWLDRHLQARPGVRVSVAGVVTGGITGVLLSNLFVIPVVIYVVVRYDVFHAADGGAAIVSLIDSNPWLYGWVLTTGLGYSLLGGYVAAFIAKHDELLNGVLSSFPCTAIGVYSILSGKDSHSVLSQLFLLGAAPACALLGGYLRQSRKRIGSALAQ